MSHLQFHCIKLFILRHAWLKSLRQAYATGRINQVTTMFYSLSLSTLSIYLSLSLSTLLYPLPSLPSLPLSLSPLFSLLPD